MVNVERLGIEHSEPQTSSFLLGQGDRITAIEAGTKDTSDGEVMTRLAFHLQSGATKPASESFYGDSPAEKIWTIEAPRIQSFYGYGGRWLHCLGLHYLELDAYAKSRDFLLAVEPKLFPDGDFGEIK